MRFITLLLIALLLSATPILAQKSQKIKSHTHLNQGIYGKVEFLEGDFMPGPGGGAKGSKTGVKRKIYLFSPALNLNTMPDLEVEGSFVRVGERNPVYKTTSSRDGKYRLPAKPGTYSIIIVEEEGLYCNGSDGTATLCPITIHKNEWELMDVQVNYKEVY